MCEDLNGRSILVVEDEFLIALGLRTQFEDMGARVELATTVADALARADASYDAAVLDVRLPDGEVFPVADDLSRRGVPFVFHSGHADGEALTRSYPGAMALAKPATDAALLASLCSVIGASDQQAG